MLCKDLTTLYFHRSRVISGIEGKGRGGRELFQRERDKGSLTGAELVREKREMRSHLYSQARQLQRRVKLEKGRE